MISAASRYHCTARTSDGDEFTIHADTYFDARAFADRLNAQIVGAADFALYFVRLYWIGSDYPNQPTRRLIACVDDGPEQSPEDAAAELCRRLERAKTQMQKRK